MDALKLAKSVKVLLPINRKQKAKPNMPETQTGSIHMIHGTHVGSNVRFTGAR